MLGGHLGEVSLVRGAKGGLPPTGAHPELTSPCRRRLAWSLDEVGQGEIACSTSAASSGREGGEESRTIH